MGRVPSVVTATELYFSVECCAEMILSPGDFLENTKLETLWESNWKR